MSPLPPTLGSTGGLGSGGSLGRPANVGRAQDFSTSQLKQHKDRAAATTSVGRAMQQNSTNGPTTSIAHPGGRSQQASTSVAHPGGYSQEASTSIAHPNGVGAEASTSVNHAEAKRSIHDEGYVDEEREKARYAFARRKIMQRKARERAEAAKGGGGSGTDRTHIKVGTGGAFTKGGAGGFSKQMHHFFKKYRGTYKNVSASDMAFFEDVVGGVAASKTTGSKFSRQDKMKMRKEMGKAMRSGKISREDVKDFNKLINNL